MKTQKQMHKAVDVLYQSQSMNAALVPCNGIIKNKDGVQMD